MHSQMVRPDHDHTVGEGEDEHLHEKKSVLKKVKAKAKKIKDTLKLHGHGHHDHDHEEGQDYLLHETPDDHDLDEEEDDEDEEMVDDPAVYGVAGLHTTLVRNSVPEQVGTLDNTRNYYGSSEAVMEDQDQDQEPSRLQRTDVLKSFVPQQEDEGNRVDVERISGIKEKPYTPVSSPESFTPGIVEQPKVVDPIEIFSKEQEAIRGEPEISMKNSVVTFEEDPYAPNKNRSRHPTPSNYETKVNDPTGEGSKEIDSSIVQQLGRMGVSKESKPEAREVNPVFPTGSHDQFSPEPSPPISINPPFPEKSSNASNPEQKGPIQSSYTEKISSAKSAIAGKAVSAKNAIATTVTEKLTPVYDKVAETGSNLMSKGKSGTEIEGQDKGVSVKGYLSEKLKPGEEDRALSEVISEALHQQKEETGKIAERKYGKVTESMEVRERLGGGGENSEEKLEAMGGSGVVSKIKEVVGSLFGKGQETRQSTRQSSIGNEGYVGNENEEETMEKRLQEGN